MERDREWEPILRAAEWLFLSQFGKWLPPARASLHQTHQPPSPFPSPSTPWLKYKFKCAKNAFWLKCTKTLSHNACCWFVTINSRPCRKKGWSIDYRYLCNPRFRLRMRKCRCIIKTVSQCSKLLICSNLKEEIKMMLLYFLFLSCVFTWIFVP